MKLTPISDHDVVMKALYGDVFSKAEKKELSNTDKGLVAANAASAALGVATLPSLVGSVKQNMPERKKPRKPASPRVANASRKLKATKIVQGATKAKNVMKQPKYALPAAGAALGGQLFNVTADAASTKSIADKRKIQKNLVLVSKSDQKISPVQTLKDNEKPHVPAGRKIKLKAMDKIETKVRQKAPAVKASVKAGTEAAANTWKAEAKVSKALEDKRQVYGWASITEMNGEPVVDLQGDYVTIEEIEKAAHAYISKSRKGGDMHRRNGADPHHVSDLIESVVITPEKKEALGMPADSPTGWWVGFQVHDEDTWNMVKNGDRPMFSIHGSGKRVDRDDLVAKAISPKAAIKATRLKIGSAKDHVEHAVRDPKGYSQYAGKRIKFRSTQAVGETQKAGQGVKRGLKTGSVDNANRVKGIQGKSYSRGYRAGAEARRPRTIAVAGGVATTGALAGGAAYSGKKRKNLEGSTGANRYGY